MAQKDVKKLSPAELKKQVKKLDAVQEFVVVVGDTDYKLTHDVVFRRTKQHKVLDDMVEFFNEGGKQIELLDMATPYTALLILKHFTSLEVPDGVDEALVLLETLIDLELLDKVLNALPEEEVKKVYELLTQTVENFRASLEASEEEAETFLEQVENEEVKDMAKEVVGIDVKEDTANDSE
jgi:hypothetical protein